VGEIKSYNSFDFLITVERNKNIERITKTGRK
jgi:hypothetical protein